MIEGKTTAVSRKLCESSGPPGVLEMTTVGGGSRPSTSPVWTRLVQEHVREAANDTSVHGISKLVSNRPVLKKIVWALLILLSAGGLVYYILQSVYYFFERPYVLDIEIKELTPKDFFPGITLCNENMYRRTPLADIEQRVGKQCDWAPENSAGRYHCIAAHANLSEMLTLGHRLDNMMYSCSLDSTPCSAANFTEASFWTDHSYCYTSQFPAVFADELRLGLFADFLEYTKSERIGAWLMLHEGPAHAPKGFYKISAGKSTEITFKKFEYERLRAPSRDQCIYPQEHEWLSDVQNVLRNYPYDREACFHDCILHATVDKCGCYMASSIGVVAANRLSLLTNKSICEASHQGHACASHVYATMVEECAISRAHLCSETEYDVAYVASLEWPTDPLKLLADITPDFNENSTSNYVQLLEDCKNLTWECERSFKNNLMEVRIGWANYDKYIVKSKPTFGFDQLCGDIGGLCGLWMGISLLSVCELVEVILDIMDISLCKRRQEG